MAVEFFHVFEPLHTLVRTELALLRAPHIFQKFAKKKIKIAGQHAKVLTGNQNMNAYLMKFVQPQPFFVQEDK